MVLCFSVPFCPRAGTRRFAITVTDEGESHGDEEMKAQVKEWTDKKGQKNAWIKRRVSDCMP